MLTIKKREKHTFKLFAGRQGSLQRSQSNRQLDHFPSVLMRRRGVPDMRALASLSNFAIMSSAVLTLV